MIIKHPGISFITISLIAFLSCQKEEPQVEITNSVPYIELLDIGFVDDKSGLDILFFHINIKDKEGNFGLNNEDIQYPFNKRNFIVDTFDDLIYYGSSDTLPEYNLYDYVILRDEFNRAIVDTVLAPINPYHTNIWVDFYIKDNGIFREFDFIKEFNLPGYDGRFPFIEPSNNNFNINEWHFSGPFEIKRRSDQEAEIIYKMPSSGWLVIFPIDTIQMHIQVLDRDLNISNKIITESFTLPGLKE